MLIEKIDSDALAGKVILVTGAGDGIGKQAALSYAQHGATVILLGKTVKKLEATYDEIEEAGWPQAAIIPLDLEKATPEEYAGLAVTIDQEFGRLDGLLNNAGVLGYLSPFEFVETATWDRVMQVNLRATFLMTQQLLPVLKKADKASVIFTTSSVARQGRAFWGPYSISKAATENMMQILADEHENTSLRFNCINPGATRTNMRASAFPGEKADSVKTPAEIIAPWLYFMADISETVSGQSIDAQPGRKPGLVAEETTH